MPWTYKYVTSHGKRDFVDMIKNPEMGNLS